MNSFSLTQIGCFVFFFGTALACLYLRKRLQRRGKHLR